MDDVVPLGTFVDGYEQAMRRFLDVRNSDDATATFIPLFEGLNWAVALDDRFEKAWQKSALYRPGERWSDGYAYGDVVKGVRCARNVVHHKWADALVMTSGAELPIQLPAAFHEWRWRAALPDGETQKLWPHYEQRLAGEPARRTLQYLSDCFGEAAVVLGSP